jgi:hypothetical protein
VCQCKESMTNGGESFMIWVTLVRERFLAEASSGICTIIQEMHVRHSVKRIHIHAAVFTKTQPKNISLRTVAVLVQFATTHKKYADQHRSTAEAGL